MKLRAILYLVGLVALAMGSLAEAKTYRWVNDQGIVTYSDQPPQVRPVEGEREALITEALEISGTKHALEMIPAHIRAQLDVRQTPIKPEEKARVMEVAHRLAEVGPGAGLSQLEAAHQPRKLSLPRRRPDVIPHFVVEHDEAGRIALIVDGQVEQRGRRVPRVVHLADAV